MCSGFYSQTYSLLPHPPTNDEIFGKKWKLFCTSIFIMSKINKYHINTDLKKEKFKIPYMWPDPVQIFTNHRRIEKRNIIKNIVNFPLWMNLFFWFTFKMFSSMHIQASVSPWFVTLKTQLICTEMETFFFCWYIHHFYWHELHPKS